MVMNFGARLYKRQIPRIDGYSVRHIVQNGGIGFDDDGQIIPGSHIRIMIYPRIDSKRARFPVVSREVFAVSDEDFEIKRKHLRHLVVQDYHDWLNKSMI